jgi:hypothetical protein
MPLNDWKEARYVSLAHYCGNRFVGTGSRYPFRAMVGQLVWQTAGRHKHRQRTKPRIYTHNVNDFGEHPTDGHRESV